MVDARETGLSDRLRAPQQTRVVPQVRAVPPIPTTRGGTYGKFTRDEAEQLIARLQAAADEEEGLPEEPRTYVSNAQPLLRRIPAEQLAGELQRRGWLVVEP